MIDPGEFLNNYAEWHYLWLGIFMGFLAGFAMGVYTHRRLRGIVQEDIVRSLTTLKVLPPGRAVGERQQDLVDALLTVFHVKHQW